MNFATSRNSPAIYKIYIIMEGEKKIIFEDNRSDTGMMGLMSGLLGKQGIDPSVMAMMNQNGGGFGGQNGMFMMLFLLLLLGRNGLNGLGGGEALNTVQNNELLMNAINGNRDAVRDLAGLTNTSITAVNTALAGLNTQLATIAGQNNLNSAQVINSIQAGNASLASQLAACCCDTRTAINEQGFQNRLSELNQTNQLVAQLNANQQQTNAGFAAVEANRQADRISSLQERLTAANFEISQRNQNDYLAARIEPLYGRLARIEDRQLPVYPQQYIPGAPVGGSVAFGYPYGGYPFGGVPFGAPGCGGCGCHHHNGSNTNP